MKNKKTLIGAATAALFASALLMMPSNGDSAYQLREKTSTNNAQGIDGAFELYNVLHTNLETGTVNHEDFLRGLAETQSLATNRADIGWKDHGPDNVGGRTRAILVDVNDDNHLYAGSVTGGLFESTNRGNAWSRVMGFNEWLSISSMCMTDNGNIYVATGHYAEGTSGTTQGAGGISEGVFVSTDDGATFTQIVETANYSAVNEVVAKGNDVFIACNTGLKLYSGGTMSNTSVTGSVKALSISNDGELIVAGTSLTYVSTDGGANFTNMSGSAATDIKSNSGRIEYAISHEKGSTGNYYIYAVFASGSQASYGRLKGVFKSTDNGVAWAETAPANDGTVGSFAPFGSNTQGWYDIIITVVKGDPDAILMGGIDVFAKSNVGNWEQRSNGFFGQMSPLYVHSDQHEMQWDSQGRLWLGNDGGIFFSDDNGNSFHEADRDYNVTQFYSVGFSAHGDVIGGAQDNGTQANYHDNATYREHDAVGGGDGFSSAISFINRDILFTTVYNGVVNRSGDRGATSNSFQASNIPASSGTPGDISNGLGSFYTQIKLYENPNDLNSTDSVIMIPTQAYSAGDEIQVASLTSQTFISYTTPTDLTYDDTLDFTITTQDTVVTDDVTGIEYNVNTLGYTFVFGAPSIDVGDTLIINGTTLTVGVDDVTTNHYWATNPLEPGEIVDMGTEVQLYNIAWDTIKVQDPYQSWMAFGLGSGDGLWLSRNALRLSADHDGFLLAADGISGTVTAMEFSGDGNHLYVGTSTGRLYRLSGLDDIYSPNPSLSNAADNIKDSLLAYDNGHYSTTFEEIEGFGAYVTGISCDKQDPDHVVVTLGQYGGANEKIQESNNATLAAASVSFSGIEGDLNSIFNTSVPFYSVVVDRDNSNLILAGCDYGVFMTSNGGSNWENVSGEFGNVPVYDMGQNWRTWDEGCKKPGEIYIGTFGRGIWSTDEYLGVQQAQDNLLDDKYKTNLLIYPNPLANSGTISFDLNSDSDVTVQIFSLTGKLVQTITTNNMSKGNNTISLNTESLANGTYFVKLTAGDLVKTTKFIKN